MNQNDLTEINGGFDQFIHMLFNAPPQSPFSFVIDFGGTPADAVLGNMLIIGSQLRYGKELSALTQREIGVLREYLLSIGWDADYHLVILYKEVLDWHPNGEPYIRQIKVNNWQITFKIADPSLRHGAGCGAQLS